MTFNERRRCRGGGAPSPGPVRGRRGGGGAGPAGRAGPRPGKFRGVFRVLTPLFAAVRPASAALEMGRGRPGRGRGLPPPPPTLSAAAPPLIPVLVRSLRLFRLLTFWVGTGVIFEGWREGC